MLIDYAGGLRASLHLDLIGRPHEKWIRFVGEEGTLLWSADPNRIAIGRTAAQQWEERTFACERNDMFVAVAREFLRVLDGAPVATCTLAEGVQVLEIVDAARRSHAEGRRVRLGGGERR
jgi:predicted dehydrogenase